MFYELNQNSLCKRTEYFKVTSYLQIWFQFLHMRLIRTGEH